jgi:ParB family chromosome partitioning protein
VVNTARLLQLPEKAREALEKGQITEGHARSVLALKNQPDKQDELLSAIIKNGWSVRQAEQFVLLSKAGKTGAKLTKTAQKTAQPHEKLSKKLGSQVIIVRTSKGGRIQIGFKDENQLDKIIDSIL